MFLRILKRWFFGERSGALVQELHQVFERDLHLASVGEQAVDPFGKHAEFLEPGERGWALCDIGSGCASFFHQTGMFQFAVGAGHRVWIDQEFFGEIADGREFPARGEDSRGDLVLDLPDNLHVDRHPVLGADVDVQRNDLKNKKASIYQCINTLIQI